jgi:hypothetical protein
MLAVEAGEVEDVPRWRRAAVMSAHRMGYRATTYFWGILDVATSITGPCSTPCECGSSRSARP